ncbi:MAG TPA: hypothetical protein VFO26_07465 [Gaiella sp.]|uniref:hypothetical protein n=1 Tax=Gaiella sp. TaxID=2663207 RepID=UPI002D7F75AD|nr:hypothetical protein [Gaiella sp.]HET9287376.1 hypothetical protein [Gaiella sp.]
MTRHRITPHSRNAGFALALLTSAVLTAIGAGSADGRLVRRASSGTRTGLP